MKTSGVLQVVVCFVMHIGISCAGCPSGLWSIPGSTQCFKYIDEGMNWSAAVSRCASEGLVLARPDDSIAVALRQYVLDTYGQAFAWLSGRGDGTKQVWVTPSPSCGASSSSSVGVVPSTLVTPEERRRVETSWCLYLAVWEGGVRKAPDSPYGADHCGWDYYRPLCQANDMDWCELIDVKNCLTPLALKDCPIKCAQR